MREHSTYSCSRQRPCGFPAKCVCVRERLRETETETDRDRDRDRESKTTRISAHRTHCAWPLTNGQGGAGAPAAAGAAALLCSDRPGPGPGLCLTAGRSMPARRPEVDILMLVAPVVATPVMRAYTRVASAELSESLLIRLRLGVGALLIRVPADPSPC
jgi:hypothetical protein